MAYVEFAQEFAVKLGKVVVVVDMGQEFAVMLAQASQSTPCIEVS